MPSRTEKEYIRRGEIREVVESACHDIKEINSNYAGAVLSEDAIGIILRSAETEFGIQYTGDLHIYFEGEHSQILDKRDVQLPNYEPHKLLSIRVFDFAGDLDHEVTNHNEILIEVSKQIIENIDRDMWILYDDEIYTRNKVLYVIYDESLLSSLDECIKVAEAGDSIEDVESNLVAYNI